MVQPKILEEPPEPIKQELTQLQKDLDAAIPRKVLDENLLIATWNLRAFGDLTEKWERDKEDSPKRNLHALRCIAEIVQRFDVIAIQEVRGNIKALRHMLKVLGHSWGFVLTDVTKGDSGNMERMAFLFDTRKVQMSGLACELVIPPELLKKVGEDALREQFARTPYAVSFRTVGSPIKKPKTFILVTLHVIYGKDAATRKPELLMISKWLSDWAKDINGFDQNLITLGDFNIDRMDDELYKAFTSTGLRAPDDLNRVPRTIFADPSNPQLNHFYDQIAWFTGESGVPALSLVYRSGGSFDFLKSALSSLEITKLEKSYMISDHLPLWVEFGVE
jgi:endonuclease/exonuclease/phosphatase family metal-dependent hydrolase